jgi:hypothetical protein
VDEMRNQVEAKSQKCATRKKDPDHGTAGTGRENDATETKEATEIRTRTEIGDDRETKENVGDHVTVSTETKIVIVNVDDRVRKMFVGAANPEIDGKQGKRVLILGKC